jgi:transcriptional regulator with PAS, ATPase and Fis domain
VALAQQGQFTVANLPVTLSEHAVHVVRQQAGRLPTLAEREADYIRYVLERSGENRTRAAKVLGIDRVSLWRKLKKYGMDDSGNGG